MSSPARIPVTITYLQMTAPPERIAARAPRDGLTVVHCPRPTVSFYRYLYNTVGRPWWWVDRRRMSDEQLAQIIQDPLDEVHVLYADGCPAGYAELDRRQQGEVELAYFGLMPEHIGQGLGRYLIDWAIARAWTYAPRRFWLHTCTLDHERALDFYQQAGFTPYKQEETLSDDPRTSGLFDERT